MSDPKLYDDSVAAGKVVKERAKVESKLEAVKGLASELQTWREMHGERINRRFQSHTNAAPDAFCTCMQIPLRTKTASLTRCSNAFVRLLPGCRAQCRLTARSDTGLGVDGRVPLNSSRSGSGYPCVKAFSSREKQKKGSKGERLSDRLDVCRPLTFVDIC